MCQISGQVETDEMENWNGKLKRKAETEKLKIGNGRHNCSRSYLLRMRELCEFRVFLSIYLELASTQAWGRGYSIREWQTVYSQSHDHNLHTALLNNYHVMAWLLEVAIWCRFSSD